MNCLFGGLSLGLLLCSSLGLGRLLLVASNHDHAEERADDRGAEEDENNGNADRPDTRGEEAVEGVVIVDEGLFGHGQSGIGGCAAEEGETNHEKRPDGVVEEDDGGGHQHGEANELVELRARMG